MPGEVFLVSVIFWVSLLFLYVLLSKRLARLTERISDLEGAGRMKGQGKG